MSAWLTDKVAPHVADYLAGGVRDLDGASHVVATVRISAGVANFIRVERVEMGGCKAVERAPRIMAGRREEIGDAALPFVVGQGEGESMSGETRRR